MPTAGMNIYTDYLKKFSAGRVNHAAGLPK